MEAFLRELLPRILVGAASFTVYPHQCKDDLLSKLPARLRGYAGWLPEGWCIVVVVDRDDDDCRVLKQRLDGIATQAGLRTRSGTRRQNWQVASRLAIEELEAWYFGDWEAVRGAYPRVSASVPRMAAYRDPDAIAGGTWEAFERVLQRAGYFRSGLRKIEVARELGRRLDPVSCRSRSFQVLRELLGEVTA